MSDSSSGPERAVRQAPTSRQQRLFTERPRPPGKRSTPQSEQQGRGFVESNPEEITIGGQPLGEYLIARDQQWVLGMREILREVEWQSWEERYAERGRPPYHPAPMAALVIYGALKGMDSLRQLEVVARTDLASMWLTGGIQPDHSTLGRFVSRHDDQFQGEGFVEMTAEILEVMPEVQREVAGDGTTLEAFASRMSKLEKEAAEQWADEKLEEHRGEAGEESREADGEQEGSNEGGAGGQEQSGGNQAQRAQQLKELVEERVNERIKHGSSAEKTKFSTTEPQAVWHRYKDGRYGFGYVQSLMVNRQRFIVGQAVDRTSETAVVGRLLEQTDTIFGGLVDDEEEGPHIERVSLDNNYFTLGVLQEMMAWQLDALIYPDHWKPEGSGQLPRRGGKLAKKAFEYDSENDSYCCPAGEILKKVRSGTDRLGRRHTTYGQSQACETCPLRGECTTARKGRTIKRFEGDELKEAMREVMNQSRAQQAYSRRMGMVEPVFGRLRERGFQRCRRRGLNGAATEVAIKSVAHNFGRFKSYIDSGRLEITHIEPRTGSYTDNPKEGARQNQRFFGATTGIPGQRRALNRQTSPNHSRRRRKLGARHVRCKPPQRPSFSQYGSITNTKCATHGGCTPF